ncbi:type II toxin-antitoxin system RelE/ParE family toxin [Cohnella sp. AR92]|uniref:type II toxin-antitoxin system RelE family toxin n=1 Tax=Cohnella sp. AR92 TaxID=648716 RepID=UPI000F8CCBA7|nr:hypothetical protein [Cohnella sp. AR92]RUS44899.1 hypothetical protein ELR57_21825 [Cohnella sp. AR92]
MYDIKFASKRVEKEMKSFSKDEIKMIEEAMNILSKNPRPANLDFGSVNRCTDVKRIKAKRLRVFYMIDDKNAVVQIGKIENRDSHCYGKDPRTWFQSRVC